MKKTDSKEDEILSHQQFKALHLYYGQVADLLNAAGLDMRAVLKPTVDIPWSKETIKEYLWRPIQKLQVHKESTKELKKKEVDLVFNTMNRHLAKHGVHQPFPSIEALFARQRELDDERKLLKKYKK